MRVIHICESYGGGVKKHLDLISGVMDSSIENLYYISPSINEKIEINSSSIVIDREFSNRRNPANLILSGFKILKYAKKNRVNIIHFHSTFAGIIAIILRPFFSKKNIKFFYTPHAYYSQKRMKGIKNYIVKFLERMILNRMDKVIHVSKQEEEHSFSNKLLKSNQTNKSIVIYNGVVSLQKVKRTLNKEHITFINVARCVDQKNPDLFIKIAVEFLKVNKNAKFLFIGDGPKLNECRTCVNDLGLSDKIEFVGYSNDVPKYLEKADFYLSTSKYEGMPYSVIESMATGLPLILSDVVGHKELIKDNGFLYDVNNIEKVVNILKKCNQLTEVAYRELANNSFVYFSNKFNAVDNIQKISLTYKKIFNEQNEN